MSDFDKLLAEVERDDPEGLAAGRKWVQDTYYGAGEMTIDGVMKRVILLARTPSGTIESVALIESIQDKIEAYAAEQVAEYKQDAERYWYLRRDDLNYEEQAYWFDTNSGEKLDAAIDAAIRARGERPSTLEQ